MKALCFGILIAFCAFAQSQRTVDELVSFVKTAIAQKYRDAEIANQVERIHLANRLDEKTITELQRLGAVPKTVASLQKLAAASSNLPAPAPAAVKVEPTLPPPSTEELKEIIAETRENSLNYTKGLPNYICSQITRRHVDPGTGSFRDADLILEKLAFFEQRESYDVVMVNDNPTFTPQKLPGLAGEGGGGSLKACA